MRSGWYHLYVDGTDAAYHACAIHGCFVESSNLAGYKAVLDAAEQFGRAFPMMMTAAGTIPPARVMVMGAGVAGLQAIATARRLGAVVSATDVRPVAKEQVESLGATFVMVEDEETKAAETAAAMPRK